VAADPIGEDNPIEAILLTAFPNPQRIGCPGSEQIQRMAEQEVLHDDPSWSHLWNCSPCFRDFKALRDARVARVDREFDRRRTRRHVMTGAVAVVISSALAYFGAVEFRSRARQVVPVTIDLTNAGPTRGSTVPSPVCRRNLMRFICYCHPAARPVLMLLRYSSLQRTILPLRSHLPMPHNRALNWS